MTAAAVFSNNWQVLPGTNGQVEYRCTGAVTQAGARCDREPTNNESVVFRINGVEYPLHRGCAGALNGCLTTATIQPSGGTFRGTDGNGGAKLLCEALGYDPELTEVFLPYQSRGTRTAAIVQTNPFVWGIREKVGSSGGTGAVTDFVWCKR